ncbi:MAG: type II toxin-antitoxin system PemK/MazF family toxin [Planctomycetes bacterium]|nr:type II toxin-antitoxin system PemK/MazF family toxin [Planctomycetota bacterium]
MTGYERGAILLMEFPFPSQETTKRRPALLLAEVDALDVVVAQVTSRAPRGRFDIPLTAGKAGGLLLPSCVRVDKIATLPKADERRVLGAVSRHEWKTVRAALRALFDLSS